MSDLPPNSLEFERTRLEPATLTGLCSLLLLLWAFALLLFAAGFALFVGMGWWA